KTRYLHQEKTQTLRMVQRLRQNHPRSNAIALSSRSSNLDGKGDKWYMAWARVEPATVNAESGYMIGTAGIATSLLHLHLANEGRYEVSLPWDNPYPTRKS
ncbi:hypothetical protein, partial [Sphingopyxis flava]